MQSCMVSNQLKGEIYVSEIAFGTSSSGKIPRPFQRQKSWLHQFWIVVPYQNLNA